MTIAHQFEYYRPNTINEILDLLTKFNRRASILAGGTDLINWLREDIIAPDALIDIKNLAELNKIEVKDDGLRIGATVTFNELLSSHLIKEKFPLIQEMAIQVASFGVCNRATMVGNICSAVPSCDSGPILLVCDAEVIIRGIQGERKIPIQKWFVGPRKNALNDGEFVVGVVLPLPKSPNAGCYVKLRRYQGKDLAQASVAILHHREQTAVAFGAVAPTPFRSKAIEQLLSGNELTATLIGEAQKIAAREISPITDIRSSKEYRSHMIEVMLERGLKTVFSRLSGTGPEYGAGII